MANVTDIAQVHVTRDLDVVSVPSFRHTIDSLIEKGCSSIVIDLSGATYMDSAGVGLVLYALKRMRAKGGRVSLTNVSSEIMYVLTVARVVDFLPVSQAGELPDVPKLDVAKLPKWRTVVQVDSSDLAGARDKVRELVARMPFSPDDAFDLVLAIGEAMGNAVDHTSGNSVVEMSCFDDRAVVEVSDSGEGFEPSEVPTQCDVTAERGRGIALMRLLSDSVEITPKPNGKGMVVRIVKLIASHDESKLGSAASV